MVLLPSLGVQDLGAQGFGFRGSGLRVCSLFFFFLRKPEALRNLDRTTPCQAAQSAQALPQPHRRGLRPALFRAAWGPAQSRGFQGLRALRAWGFEGLGILGFRSGFRGGLV